MEITSETQWLKPVRMRVAGKVMPSRNVGIVYEPIIASGRQDFGAHMPDRLVGVNIACDGAANFPTGRFEFWIVNDMWKDNPNPFVYFVFESVEWTGSFGVATRRFGFMGVKSKTRGWSEYQSMRSGD